MGNLTAFMGQMLSDTRKDDSMNNYKIVSPTHLIRVTDAISSFPDAITEIKKTINTDKQIDSELKKIPKVNDFELMKSLCWYEKHNRKQLYKILDKMVIEVVNTDGYLENRIHDKKGAESLALAISIIDDYMDYLELGEYNGPVTRI